MAVDFEKIQDCVWKLFDHIIWPNPEKYPSIDSKCWPFDEPRIPTQSELARARSICWGWDPPLMEEGSDSELTPRGLAAAAWRVEQLHGRLQPQPPVGLQQGNDPTTHKAEKPSKPPGGKRRIAQRPRSST